MRTEVSTPATSNPLRWVVEWARSESFWRDVASRALAGTIVVALGAAAAVAFGIIDWREFGRGAAYVAASCLAFAVALQLTIGLIRPIYKFFGKAKNPVIRVLLEGVGTLLIAIPVFTGMAIVQFVFPLIASL